MDNDEEFEVDSASVIMSLGAELDERLTELAGKRLLFVLVVSDQHETVVTGNTDGPVIQCLLEAALDRILLRQAVERGLESEPPHQYAQEATGERA